MRQFFRFSTLFFIVIAALAIASGISLYTQSIRLDESQQIWISAKPLGSILKLIGQDVHVPLYAILVHYWMQILGSDINVVRTLSLCFYVATLPALYILVKDVSGKRVALWSALLFAVSPFIIWYSQEARMYTLFTFVTCINHFFFLRFYRSRGNYNKLGYFLSLLFGLYTHYFFNLVIASQGIFVLYHWSIKSINMRKKEHVTMWQSIFLTKGFPLQALAITGLAYLFFIPWIAYVLHLGSISNETPLIPPPTSYNIFQTFVNFLFGFQTQSTQAVLVSLWPLFVIFLFFIFTQRKLIGVKNLDYFLLVTFAPIVLVFLTSYIRPLFLSRYLILITPTMFFLLAWCLSNFPKRIAFLTTSFVLCSMVFFLLYQNTSAASPIKEDYKDTTLYLNTHATPSDVIAVSAPFTVYPIEYYYQGKARITTIPAWDRYTEGPIPQFSNAGLQKQIANDKQIYKRIFIVLSYDQGYEKSIRTYMDQHYQVLMHKKFSTGIEVRVYKLRYDI